MFRKYQVKCGGLPFLILLVFSAQEIRARLLKKNIFYRARLRKLLFAEKVEKWEDHVDWADVIVFDDVEFGQQAERLRKKGKLVVGGADYTDRLEMDREFGQMEMKKCGINILPQWQFSNYDEAIDFIKK